MINKGSTHMTTPAPETSIEDLLKEQGLHPDVKPPKQKKVKKNRGPLRVIFALVAIFGVSAAGAYEATTLATGGNSAPQGGTHAPQFPHP
jgi:hypothetical protein